MAAPSGSKPDIILNSPVGAKPAVYQWPITYKSKGQVIDGAAEIIETIRWVAREYLEFKPAIENLLPEQPDLRSYECIKGLCDKYNKIPELVMKMNKGTSVALKTSSRAPQGLVKHIIQQVYNYAVADPAELNKYSPFSSETYGETSFEFMAQLIDRNQFRPRAQDIFIDLGSGVGHIVLQMAALVECKKCYGIEIADRPAEYARSMEERFKFWMNWYGKTYTDFELIHGDFFGRQYAEIIKNATYILVNNFAFKPEVDHKLKQRFLDLKDGTQILSSKLFCSLKSRVNERNLTDIGSIMHVREVMPDQKKDSVSWTPKPLPYYLHVLDGSRVERYYERQKRRQNRSTDEKGRTGKRRRNGENGSDSLSDDSEDNTVYGPTTRRAWSKWCNSGSMNTNNRASTDSVKTASSRNNSTDTENYEAAIEEEEEETTVTKGKDNESQKRDKKIDTQNAVDKGSSATQENCAQSKNASSSNQAPKSCLDKKRDYAIKKSGTNYLPSAPPLALYSISKPAESMSGSSTTKIPNIVIKVKPSMEVKVLGDSTTTIPARAAVASEIQKTAPPKVNDENGKQLRQRKRSTPADTAQASTAPTKSSSCSRSDAKTSQSGSSILSQTTNGTRKRAAASTTRSAARVTKKKAVSPDKNSSLDLLHAKTIESVARNAGQYSQPAPGCEDHMLESIVETPSLPKVTVKDLTMFVSAFLGPKNIEKFISSTKQEFENFAKKIQQPGTKEALLVSIELEKIRNRDLLRAEEELTKNIKTLTERVPKATKNHCEEFGIQNSQRSIVNHLGALLKKYQDLSAYSLQLEATLQPSQRTMNPPAAHSNSHQNLSSPYRVASSPATLDLSLKQVS